MRYLNILLAFARSMIAFVSVFTIIPVSTLGIAVFLAPYDPHPVLVGTAAIVGPSGGVFLSMRVLEKVLG